MRGETTMPNKLNPKLHEYFENLPIRIKNEILELNCRIETLEELKLAVELIEQQDRCCGDL